MQLQRERNEKPNVHLNYSVPVQKKAKKKKKKRKSSRALFHTVLGSFTQHSAPPFFPPVFQCLGVDLFTSGWLQSMWWKRMKYKESFAARPEGQSVTIWCNYAVITVKGGCARDHPATRCQKRALLLRKANCDSSISSCCWKKIQRVFILTSMTAGMGLSLQYLIKIAAQLIRSLCFGIYLSQYLYYSHLRRGSNKEEMELRPQPQLRLCPLLCFNAIKLKKKHSK